MCGIAGVYEYGEGAPVNPQVLQAMLAVLYHRGPDDEGLYSDGGLAMGMRRLSIIDLAGGKQPLFSEDRRIVTVFNGEIYNYQELTRDLKARGHVFSTASDTEVIVHLYEEYGEACVHHLRGMFAFAIWDTAARRLFLARDRLGIKPLYYTQRGQRLIFGSEIKALLQHPGVEAGLDTEGLSHFLSLKYIPAPWTMFANISALPPGHSLSCDPSGVTIRSYWDLSFRDNQEPQASDEVYAEQLEALLRESITLHMRSDVSFGAFLSGGLDSSLVVALMSEVLGEPVKTFSVGFQGSSKFGEQDELPYARLIAQQYHTEHYDLVLQPQDLLTSAEKVIWHLDQPLADQATVAMYMVSELASQHVKMVLTGEGGDELFAGYARYVGERFSPLFQALPGPVKSLALALSNHLPGLRRAKIALYALCLSDEVTRFANWFPLFNQDTKAALLSGLLKQKLNGKATEDIFAYHLSHTDATAALNRMLYVDTKLWLPDYLLTRGDKLSMAASLEARVPLLDHKVAEFAAALPAHLKLRGFERKYLLRRVGRKFLPAEIFNRKKQGFPIPISAWFRKEVREFVRDTLSPTRIRRRGLFNSHYVEQLQDEHEAGKADHGSLLWGLMNVELWHRLFIDTPHGEKSSSSRDPAHVTTGGLGVN